MATRVTKALRALRSIQQHHRALSTEAAAAASKPGHLGYCFELSEEQKEYQNLARKFAREEILPKAAHYDRTGEFPWDIVKKAFEVGLMNLSIPAKYGGSGLSLFSHCLVTEEIAYGCSGIKTVLEATDLGVMCAACFTGSACASRRQDEWCSNGLSKSVVGDNQQDALMAIEGLCHLACSVLKFHHPALIVEAQIRVTHETIQHYLIQNQN